MALFRNFFYRKLPEGLLEISERVFVFGCCFTTNLLEGTEYQVYIGHIVDQLREYFPDASFTVHNFGGENHQSQITNLLSEYRMTVINYPYQYQNCPLPLPPLETIHHFLRSTDNWLSIGQMNVLLMHCVNGALPVLAFMCSAFLPLQLRYLEYVSTRNIDFQWPPTGRALNLGCRPIFRICGPDPLMAKEDGFLESSPAIVVESPNSESFPNDTNSETPSASSKPYIKIESSELQVSVHRPTQSKIISNFLQVPHVPLTRYRSATSALGITALLHDHAEFSNREVSCPFTPEFSVSAYAPSLPKPVECNNSTPSFFSSICKDSSFIPAKKSTLPAAPSPPPPPQRATVSTSRCSPLPPACPPCSSVQKESPTRIRQVVPPPPPPAPLSNGLSKGGGTSLQLHSYPLGSKGKLQLRTSTRIQAQPEKTSLRPYHWLKLTRAIQGSLWAEAHKPKEVSKVLELDMSELESLFSTTIPNPDHGGTAGKTNRRGSRLKPDKVHVIELRRAYNCEIMLTKVKVPLSDLTTSVLALDDSVLDIDQVDNLIKFCPTNEEIELLKNYNGDKENLGKCEQFFLELTKVPRVESKLRVFSFKIQFYSQVSDLRNSLNIVNSASQEVRDSVKLKRIMQSILSLGNALNHGTARGSAVGFRLDSLLKLSETRSRNNKLTLIHYLCKVLAEKLPEVLDFHEDLVSLEAATKIQLKYLSEEMQAISKGLEKVVQELTASENDGAAVVSQHLCKTLKDFYGSAEEEVRSVASIYSLVGRNADALALYFGEDPARCSFEQVVSTLLNFVRMFRRAHEENCKQLEFEKKKKKKAPKEAYS